MQKKSNNKEKKTNNLENKMIIFYDSPYIFLAKELFKECIVNFKKNIKEKKTRTD